MPRNFSSPFVSTFRLVALLLVLAVSTGLAAQDVNPFAGDPKAGKAGVFLPCGVLNLLWFPASLLPSF